MHPNKKLGKSPIKNIKNKATTNTVANNHNHTTYILATSITPCRQVISATFNFSISLPRN